MFLRAHATSFNAPAASVYAGVSKVKGRLDGSKNGPLFGSWTSECFAARRGYEPKGRASRAGLRKQHPANIDTSSNPPRAV